MFATHPRSSLIASFAMIAALAPASPAQVTTGADRYIGSTQASINRTNGMIASMVPSHTAPGMGGTGSIGAVQQSLDRTNVAMRVMLANRAAMTRGLSEQTINRTPDNLYGVYWRNYYANEARLWSTYTAMAHGRGLVPIARADELHAMNLLRQRSQHQARSQEFARRFNRRSPEPLPNPGGFTPEMLQNRTSNADLIRDEQARGELTITVAPPLTPTLTGRRPASD